MDFRLVNKRIVADSYPLPLLWDNLQLAAHHEYYITLDLNNGFWNLPLAEASKPITALITHLGQFEFNVLPFGIKNSPGEFQRAVDTVLGDLYGTGVLAYIDDIVIYANDLDSLFTLFEQVLSRLLNAGVYIKIRKCEFILSSAPLLGHVISRAGIQPCPKKVEALRNAPTPTNKDQVRSLPGAATYLRRFVPDFSTIAEPLTRLTKKGTPFVWNDEEQHAFTQLKTCISDQVLLIAPDGNKPFVVITDASLLLLHSVR